jgi:microcystin-dependent protein
MSSQFIGEIRAFSFNFPPKGWALCNGQVLPINQNQALFSLLGTNYGGNGQTYFQLPNLQGCVPSHAGPQTAVGESGGSPTVTLGLVNLPLHTHALNATTASAGTQSPGGNSLSEPARNGPAMYVATAPNVSLGNGSVGPAGSGVPYSSLQPSLCLNFCIALQGIYPSRN